MDTNTRMSDKYSESKTIRSAALFLNEIKDIIIKFKNEGRFINEKDPFVIADLGMANGINSIIYFKEILNIIKESNKDFQIIIYLNDLPQNLWTQAIQNVENGLKEYQNVYIYILGKSFYEPLFPEFSIDLFLCNNMLYYLSELPSYCNKFNQYPVIQDNKNEENYKLWEKRSNSDMKSFFDLRMRELKTNGVMYFTILSFNDIMTEEDNKFVKVIITGTRSVLSKTLKNNNLEEFDHFLTQNTVFRQNNQFKSYFENSSFKLLEFKTKDLYFKDKNMSREELIVEAIKYVRGFTEATYLNILEEYVKDIEKVGLVINEYFNKDLKAYYETCIDNYPEKCSRLLIIAQK